MDARSTRLIMLATALLACGCARKEQPPPAAPVLSEATASESAPAGSAAVDSAASMPTEPLPTYYPKVGIQELSLPADWREVEPPKQMQLPKIAQTAAFQRGDGLPLVVVVGLPKESWDKIKQGDRPLNAYVANVKAKLIAPKGSLPPPQIVDEGDWTVSGVISGKRLRVTGRLPELEAEQAAADLLFGETEDGSLINVFAYAPDLGTLQNVRLMLDSLRVGSVDPLLPGGESASATRTSLPDREENGAG